MNNNEHEADTAQCSFPELDDEFPDSSTNQGQSSAPKDFETCIQELEGG